jgi:hypothetical protein
MAAGLVIGGVIFSSGLERNRFLLHHAVIEAAIGAGCVLLACAVLAYKRMWAGMLAPLAAAPIIIGSALERAAGHRTPTTGTLVGVGIVAGFCVAIGAAMFYARGIREFERRMFTESTSAAFFITVLATGIYGVVERFTRVPKLALIWVPVFGAFTWAALEWLFGKRYS